MTPTQLRLRKLLERDSKKGCLVMGRSRHISRRHYASRVGVTQHALLRYASEFHEVESRLGISTAHDAKVPAMRRWLNNQLRTGSLSLNRGCIDRTGLRRQFDVPLTVSLKAYPGIHSLVEEFDKRVAAEGYLPRAQRSLVARLKRILNSKTCPLDRDRLTINCQPIATTLGLTGPRLRKAPFAALVREKEAALLEAAKRSKIDPYFHGRIYAFSALVPHWSVKFVTAIAVQFTAIYSARSGSTAVGNYHALHDALDWIGSSSHHPACLRCRRHVSQGLLIAADDWEDALGSYRHHFIKSSLGPVTKAERLVRLNATLRALANAGIVPQSSPMRGPKSALRKGGHLRSVAETPNGPSRASPQYIDFAQEALVQASNKFSVEVSDDEASSFMSALEREVAKTGQQLPPDPAAAILMLLTNRLNSIGTVAAQLMKESSARRELGRGLLTHATIDAAEFHRMFLVSRPNSKVDRNCVRRLFPEDDEASDTSIANLLSLAVHQFGGILPSVAEPAAADVYGSFFQKRYTELGGQNVLDSLLNPAKDAYGAALTLYLCESGANVTVGRTLSLDCIEDSDLPSHNRITGHKARAAGKPIIVDLPKASPACQAIEWIAAESANHRRKAPPNEADRLFVVRIGTRCDLMNAHWYLNWFKQFANSIPELAGLNLVPSMLRPSVLLKAALENDGRLQVGIALGQHSVQATKGYQHKWPIRLIYDQRIRQFQHALEVLVASKVPAAAARLGISAEEFQRRLGSLHSTGLGTFCVDPAGRPGNSGRPCSSLDCWNDCPQMVLLAQPEPIAALQIWQAALRAAEPDWQRDRPERWESVWLPWLCLTDVVEEKMARGSHRRVWTAATAARAQIEASPGFTPPRPW